MKKLLILSVGALLALPAVARDFTYTYEGNTVTYTVIDETSKICMTKEGKRDQYGKFNYGGSGNYVSGMVILPAHPMDGSVEYNLIEIGAGSFYFNLNLDNVEIPESVSSIGEAAFGNCQQLKTVFIPSSVLYISDSAFAGCIRMGRVEIPGYGSRLTYIGDYAFVNCGLSYIEEGVADYIPSQISLPESVTHIGEGAFIASCWREISLPKSITYISKGTFKNSYLKEITLSNDVDSIGDEAFMGCTNLQSVTVPINIKEKGLGQKVWADCPNIQDVYYMTTSVYPGPANAATNIFDEDVYKAATLHVAEGMVPTFMNVNPWKLFGKIVDGTSGISVVDADTKSAQPGEIFNLNGVKVGTDANALAPGLYIVRKGDSVKKIAVK